MLLNRGTTPVDFLHWPPRGLSYDTLSLALARDRAPVALGRDEGHVLPDGVALGPWRGLRQRRLHQRGRWVADGGALAIDLRDGLVAAAKVA